MTSVVTSVTLPREGRLLRGRQRLAWLQLASRTRVGRQDPGRDDGADQEQRCESDPHAAFGPHAGIIPEPPTVLLMPRAA